MQGRNVSAHEEQARTTSWRIKHSQQKTWKMNTHAGEIPAQVTTGGVQIPSEERTVEEFKPTQGRVMPKPPLADAMAKMNKSHVVLKDAIRQ